MTFEEKILDKEKGSERKQEEEIEERSDEDIIVVNLMKLIETLLQLLKYKITI